jgi:hypothetical protein
MGSSGWALQRRNRDGVQSGDPMAEGAVGRQCVWCECISHVRQCQSHKHGIRLHGIRLQQNSTQSVHRVKVRLDSVSGDIVSPPSGRDPGITALDPGTSICFRLGHPRYPAGPARGIEPPLEYREASETTRDANGAGRPSVIPQGVVEKENSLNHLFS